MQLLSYSVGLLAQVWKIYMRFQGGVAWYENWAGAMHSWNSRLTACFKLNSSLKPILNNFSNSSDTSCIWSNSNVFFSLYAYFLIACCLLWPWSNSWLWRIFNPFIYSLHYSTAANSGFTVVTNRDTFMMIVNFLLLQVQVVSNKLQLSAIPCTMEWRFGGQFEPPYRIQARYFSCHLRNII